MNELQKCNFKFLQIVDLQLPRLDSNEEQQVPKTCVLPLHHGAIINRYTGII